MTNRKVITVYRQTMNVLDLSDGTREEIIRKCLKSGTTRHRFVTPQRAAAVAGVCAVSVGLVTAKLLGK